jgi:hypothetical protein
MRPSITWKDQSTAVVKVVVFDETNSVSSERAPRARLIGTELDLCFNLEPPVLTPNGVTVACGPPAFLEFTVTGIPRGHYRPFIGLCWPKG